MKHIEINIIQFLLLIIFIYLFTYFWLPKINVYKTNEYKELAFKYINLLDEKNYLENTYINIPNQYTNTNTNTNTYSESSIGSKNSAHSTSINPRNIYSNDNDLVDRFIF
jgi:hypothetical protein